MANEVFLELSKLKINILKFEEATLTWLNSHLTVLTEKGVHLFQLSHNVQSWEKRIDCIQSFISHPKYSPTDKLFTDKIINKDLKNIHQVEMIVDHALWPHNKQLLQEMSTIVDFKWSPVGVIDNCDSAIAILTNVGVVEIYIQQLFKWQCILQISTMLSEKCEIETIEPKSVSVLKDTVYMLTTSAMCWSPILNQDKSCYFITAQKNGNIILWLIECKERKATAKVAGSFQIDTCEIHSMVWVPKCNETFLLVCSNVLGQIIVLDCHIYDNDIELLQSITLWSHKDKMIAKLLEYIEIDNNILLVCNKHRHILVLMFDKKCNVLGYYMNNINDYRITCINKSKNEIYVTTINNKIYKLNVTMVNKELEMNLNLIEFQGVSASHEMYGIAYSPNQALCAICVCDRKVSRRKEQLKLDIIFASTKDKYDSLLDMLLLNPTKRLTDYWDVIEVLRYKCLKTKEAPSVAYDQLYEMASSNVYMLKVYLILHTLCDSLKKTFKIGPEFRLPEEYVDIVKEEILVSNADKLIREYHKQFQEGRELNVLEKQYFIGAKKFLEYYFQKNKKNFDEFINPNILSIFDTNTSFICQFCDDEVTGFKCKNEHLNMFCALTFTPIEDDSYLICKWCNLTARKELYSENPLCVFCDVHLKFVDE